MANKKVLTSLDFERKARLFSAVIGTEARGSISVAPDGSIIYDQTPGTQINTQPGFYARQEGQWHRFITSFDIDFDTDFTVAPNGLATRETIRQYVESVLTSIGGSFRGAWDPTGGIVPNSPNIKAGDSWRISVAADIPGLPGSVTQVEVGDLIIASVDAPANAGDFFVLQTNISDSSNILVGGGNGPITQLPGDVEGQDSVQTAIQKLAYQLNNFDFSARAGFGIRYEPTDGTLNVDIASNGGLEFDDTTTDAQLRLKGLADYSSVDAADRIALGIDANGNLVVNKSLLAPNISAVAGSGLTYNATTQKIDLGGTLTENVNIGSTSNHNFNLFLREDPVSGGYVIFNMLSSGSITTRAEFDDKGATNIITATSSVVRHNLFAMTATNVVSFRVENSDSGGGFYLQSDYPEYALPSSGSFYNLAVNNEGKIVFQDTTASAKFSETITGNATATSFTVTHNKNSKDVLVQVFDVATDDEVEVTISRTTVNAVDIIFAVAPPNGQAFRVVII